MSSPESISAATQRIIADPERLDILINNAALLLGLTLQPTGATDAILRDTFEVNFFGPHQLLRELDPLLKASSGRALKMATQVAMLTQLADPHSPLKKDICPAYQSSKIALNALTVLFAKELAASGAKVNSACPGWVPTDMGHEELPDCGDAVNSMTPAEAVAAYLWLTGPGTDLPTGGFFTGHEAVAW